MNLVPIGEICDLRNGRAFKPTEWSTSGTPIIRIQNLTDETKPFNYCDFGVDAKFHVESGNLLFSWSGTPGTSFGAFFWRRDRGYLNQHIFRIDPHSPKELNLEYFRLALNQKLVEIISQAHGGVGLQHITKEKLNKIRVYLPELVDQIRIAHLLGKVEGLISQRKQHLHQLDDLLKSVFLEMFGDPVRNEKGWDKKRFGDLLVDIESGKSPKCEARPASKEEWGVLKLGAVTKCSYNERENKALPENVPPSVRDEVQAGDLLFSRKNTYELVAACAYVFSTRPRLLMPDLIFRFVFRGDAGVNPIYMWKLLTAKSQRLTIQSLAAGAAGSMPNISKSNIREAQLPIPPLPLQNRFAVIVEKVEGLKSRYQNSLTDLESLYGALSQQAFKGELDLSRVPLPGIQAEAAKTVATEPLQTLAEQDLAINLPDSSHLLDALGNTDARAALITQWLKAYCGQLGSTPFSVQRLMAAAQTRLAELHPDTDFKLGANDYEHIKTWVFEALDAGTLTQAFDDAGNRVELKAAFEKSPV